MSAGSPNFAAVFFRRTTPQITNPGALWDQTPSIRSSVVPHMSARMSGAGQMAAKSSFRICNFKPRFMTGRALRSATRTFPLVSGLNSTATRNASSLSSLLT